MSNAATTCGATREEEGRIVWLGIYVPEPSHPSQPERVERVFATERAAIDWSIETPAPRQTWSAHRRIERHEVVDA